MSDTYRLQLRHGAEIQNFGTRDKVTAYIKGQLEYAKVSLLPYEPILFFYGEEGEKNAMIMVGLPEGQNHDGNSFFVVDTAELQEEIDNMGSKYDEVIEELKAEDEKLEKAIKEEEESRKAADEAEENARIEADEKEVNERQTADEAEAKARSEKDAELEQAIVEEAETRANKDEELQESIDFTNDDLQSVIKACGLIYNEMLSSDRVNYVPDLHDEIIRDSESLSDAVDKISKFVTKLGQDLKFKVENTDTVNLSLESNEKDGGNILSADVNIAGVDGLSKSTFDNNILGKTSDGLYAAASIVPSTKNPNVLIFKTSGYVDGKFKVDAYETEVELTAYKGDTGKETGVNVSVDSNENKIYAELNLSSNKNNILKLEDGEYVVEGTSKNIKYKDTTVFAALKDHETHIEEIEDTIEFVKAVDVKPSETETVITTVDKSSKGDFVVGANVKLSSDKSIIVANGGLKADVSATFKKGTSTLTIYVGNNTYDIDLSDLAVSVLKSATYDASNEELVLEFIVGDTTKTVRVPVGTLIHDIEVDDTDTVDMTLKSVYGGPNHISAEVKVDKSHSDNILTVTSNGLYVSKAYITDAVSVETTERKEADKELKSKLDEVSALAQTNKENLAEEISRAKAAEQNNAKDIAQEIKDARAAEKANADAIAENKVAISENAKAIADETLRALNAEEANADAIVAEKERAIKAESDNANAIKSEVDRAVEKEADLLNRIGDNDVKIKENKDAIASEVSRATNAEQELNNKATELATNLANEVSRASAAEAKNANDISNEVSRATTAEGVLEGKVSKNTADIEANSNAIATESTRATAAEEKLTTDLTEEITRAQAADQANAQAVVAEKERALSAEGVLDGRVLQNESNITANTAAITSEATRAQGAEAILTTNLTDEITRAKAAEEANAKAVVVEKDRAVAEETELKSKVSKNTSDISTNTTDIQGLKVDLVTEIGRAKDAEEANALAVVTEKGRAEHIEADLLEKINKNASDIESISTEVGNIELKKESELSYALYVNGVKHGEFTIPKDQFLKSVNYNPTTKELVFVFNTTDGEVTTTISIADLVDVYTAGDGLSLNGNAFSVDFTTVSSVEAMQAAVNAEASRATAAEEANALAVVTEKGRAEGKEAELLEKINTNTSNIAKNTSDIANEVSRAKDAEQANATAIMAEESRAKEAESENKNAIEKEISDARAAETAISEKVTKNESDIAAVKVVADKAASDLSLEVARAKAAEEANATAIMTEESRAKDAETVLTTKINDEATRAKAAETTITTNLENEVNRATTAEEANATLISNEVNRAKDAEADLLSKVNAEATRAQGVEATLTSDLANEITRATAAEKANSDAVASEKTRAEEKETDLLEKINKNTEDIAAISTEVGDIELVKEGDLSYALYVNGTKHGEFTIPKDQFLKSVNYNASTKELVFVFNTTDGEVTTTISIADLVDTYEAGDGLVLNGNVFSVDLAKVASVDFVNNAVNTETLRAKAQEEHITSLINSEVERAKAKEDLLKSDIVDVKSDISDVEASVDTNKTEISTLKTKLESEIVRATAAEKLNSDAIDAEKGRAQGEEKRLENSISINAGQIEVIRTSISDERIRAIEKEGKLSLDIANEASRAQLKENELDGKVASEVERARQAEASLDTKISDQKTYTDSVKSELVDSIELVKDSVSDTKAELTTSINNKANSSDVYTKSETTELFDGYAKTSEIQSKLNEKLNVTDAQYTYATKDSVQEIKSTYASLDDLNNVNTQLSNRIDSNEDSIDNINLTYNTATSELVYTDKKGLMHTYKLYSGSLIKKGEFDPKTNSIVLTIENGGVESQITIPVSELLSDLSDKIDANSSKIEALKDALNKLANKWTTTSSSTVDLNKTTSGDVDILTADVRVASSNKQAIVSTGGGLYVSNDLEDYTCVFGSEGTITGQNAISKLLETTTAIRSEFDNRITNNSNEIERLKTDIANNKSEIANVKSDVQTNKSEISTIKTQVNSNTVEIQTVKERFNTLDTKVGSLETRLVTAETTINNLNTKVTNLETELNTVKNSLSQQDGKITNLETTIQSLQTLVNSLINGSLKDLTDEIAKINNVTGYSTYSNTKNIPSRLDDLEGDTTDLYGEITTIKTDLIGTPDSTNDGSVWSELNNMVDAGTY